MWSVSLQAPLLGFLPLQSNHCTLLDIVGVHQSPNKSQSSAWGDLVVFFLAYFQACIFDTQEYQEVCQNFGTFMHWEYSYREGCTGSYAFGASFCGAVLLQLPCKLLMALQPVERGDTMGTEESSQLNVHMMDLHVVIDRTSAKHSMWV